MAGKIRKKIQLYDEFYLFFLFFIIKNSYKCKMKILKNQQKQTKNYHKEILSNNKIFYKNFKSDILKKMLERQTDSSTYLKCFNSYKNMNESKGMKT